MAPREQRTGDRIDLTNLRLGFACKQRWDDMVGDDRVRLCGACDREVFNLSEMTRAEAEAVLATRGLKPCVRFYRRPDGTVVTRDCPSGVPAGRRRLAVVASSLAAAGSALAAPGASADPVTASDGSDAAIASDAANTLDAAGSGSDGPVGITLDTPIHYTGIPVPGRAFEAELGGIEEVGAMTVYEQRPAVEWSLWVRAGIGEASQRPDIAARRVTAPPAETGSITEAALGAELTFGLARRGDLRAGAWGELRTTSDPVAGAELVLEGLPPHPYDSRIGGTGSLVVRAGANAHVITGALGFGYVGSWPRFDPWVGWARHVVGARLVLSVTRERDAPRDWSATLGLEIEPLGLAHAVFDIVTRR
ncbi:MAG TPA: hypothetical protein VLT45_05740 [Kofleriaceae bacterium]|nr:hypothetical protein [Kofleriaceae bacterium]